MKKYLGAICILCAVILVGCGKDPVAQKIAEEIENLGTVTLSDEDKIEKIYDEYNTLTDSQKKQVKNYVDLLNARDSIVEQKEQAEKLYLEEQANLALKAEIREKNEELKAGFILEYDYTICRDPYYNVARVIVIQKNGKRTLYVYKEKDGWFKDNSGKLGSTNISEVENNIENPDSVYEYKIDDTVYSSEEEGITSSADYMADISAEWLYYNDHRYDK